MQALRAIRSSCLLILALAVAACTPSQRDYDFLVTHALMAADVHAEIGTVVLAPDLPAQARTAARKHYKTLDEAAVTQQPGFALAQGLAVLRSVTIEGQQAEVVVLTGPIRADAFLDCGTTHAYSYRKSSTGWTSGIVEETVC